LKESKNNEIAISKLNDELKNQIGELNMRLNGLEAQYNEL